MVGIKWNKPTLFSTAILFALFAGGVIYAITKVILIILDDLGYGLTLMHVALFVIFIGALVALSMLVFLTKRRTIIVYN